MVPVLGTLAQRMATRSEAVAMIPLAYLIGGIFATMAWVLYSLFFLALAHAEKKLWPSVVLPLAALAIVGAAAGAASGLLAFGVPWCAGRSAYVGGWWPCARELITHDYVICLLPGLVCGLLSSLLFQRDAA